jgi:PKD repeat protein
MRWEKTMRTPTTNGGSARGQFCARSFLNVFLYIGILFSISLLSALSDAANAAAGEVKLAWDLVPDSRVSLYEVHHGQQSGHYDDGITVADSQTNTVTVVGLEGGLTYYFAVRACTEGRALCSDFSNEVSAAISPSAPAAGFGATETAGPAPLTVGFSGESSGAVSDWLWNFGDGGRSTAQSPSHVYTIPGTYSVSLTATGPGGSGTHTKAAFINVSRPLVAAFAVSESSGMAPLVVTFNDESSGNIRGRLWNFGDGSTAKDATVAVHQYENPGTYTVSLTVDGPGGATNKITKADAVTVGAPLPKVGFSGSPRSGSAPMAVHFRDLSRRQGDSWYWDFGDGTHSTERNPSHTYAEPGVYSVSLTVSGRGGSNTRGKADYIEVREPSFAWEAGELMIDHIWQRVEFTQNYSDPIVVAKSPTSNKRRRAVVRVDSIDSTGFRIRIQNWDYLRRRHAPESIGYLVMERGSHLLPDGTPVEAGSIETDATGTFVRVELAQAFTTPPVVFAGVTSFEETDAVTTRIRNVAKNGFEVGMTEQEANDQAHDRETIDFIAWPTSYGNLDGLRYEVGRTASSVRKRPYRVGFRTGFSALTSFMADIQSANNPDPGSLRRKSLTLQGVKVWIQEERSADRETRARKEVVGYIVIGADLACHQVRKKKRVVRGKRRHSHMTAVVKRPKARCRP